MIVRKVKPGEVVETQKLKSIAFHYPIDIEAAVKQHEQAPESSHYDKIWACFNDEGRPVSCMTNWPMAIYYDGHVAGMGGIGGVASAPEARMQGGIRAIFSKVFEDDRAEGRVFSMLFPFSHSYYRKFGYELCHEGRVIRFPTLALKPYRQTGEARLVLPEEGNAALRPVYEAYASRYTFAMARDDLTWSRMIQGDPYAAKGYTYLLAKDGRDRAYCHFGFEREPDGMGKMIIRDYAYLDREALHDLLGFLYKLSADCRHIQITVPDGFEMSALQDEPYDIDIVRVIRIMARVIDVYRALSLMRHPQFSGSYSLYVEDAFLPENTGAYRVSFGPDGTHVLRAGDGRDACDLAVSVQAFAQLCLGYISLDMASLRQDVCLAANHETLSRVFVRKPTFMTDHF